MPIATVSMGTSMKAAQEDVFGYVSDLARHEDWSAEPLKAEAVSDDPIAVGKEYRSVAEFRGSHVNSEIRVTEYEPSSRFAFRVKDPQGTYTHEITFRTEGAGTHMDRKIVMDVSFPFWLMIKTIGWLMVGKPGMKKSYQRLEAKLEK